MHEGLGLLPPMDETISSAGSSPAAKPSRAATSRAGLGVGQPSDATTRMLSARRAGRARSGPPRPVRHRRSPRPPPAGPPS